MPIINEYKCDNCGFKLPTGWGGHTYVEDDEGKRIVCPHPSEYGTIRRVLGENAPPKLVAKRVGYNTYCICLNCLNQFEADFGYEKRTIFNFFRRGKDRRECPKCKSHKIRTELEIVGKKCPKCKEGKITETMIGES
jgi:primosomal protein N'